MRDTIKQIILVLTAGLLAIPVANWALAGMQARDGMIGVPITIAENTAYAIVCFLVANVWFGILGLVVGRLSHRYTGALVFALGWVLVARRGVPVDDLIRFLDTFDVSVRTTYLLFIVESLLWYIPAAIMIFLLSRFTPSRYEDEETDFINTSCLWIIPAAFPFWQTDDDSRPHRRKDESEAGPTTTRGFFLGLILAIGLTFVFARTNLKGQSVFGVMAACTIAATVVRLFWPTCSGSVLFGIPVLTAIVAHTSSALMMANDALARLASGTVWPLARPMPLDFLAAGCFGIALGIGIARSFGHEEHGGKVVDHAPSAPVVPEGD